MKQRIHQTEHNALKVTVFQTTSSPRRKEEAHGQAFESSSALPSFCFISVLFTYLSTCDSPRFHRAGDKGGFLAGLESSPPPPSPSKKGQLYMTLQREHDLTEGEKTCNGGSTAVTRTRTGARSRQSLLAKFTFFYYKQALSFFQHVSVGINGIAMNYIHIFFRLDDRKEVDDCT